MKTIHALLLACFLAAAAAPAAMAQEDLVSIKNKAPVPPAPVTAKDGPDFKKMKLVSEGTVTEVLKSDMIMLDNNKRYRLDNIRIPVEFDQIALAGLKETLLNRKVKLYTSRRDEDATDRYGVPVVQAIRDDGLWIQGEMVAQGMSWAFSSEISRPQMKYLIARENDARATQRGFWYSPTFAIRTSRNVHNDTNTFQIVEGKILEVVTKYNDAFFNFGTDWKTDFTIAVPKRYWSNFTNNIAQQFTPEHWVGHKVRVRGWVEDKYGPMIQVTHPEQIEILDNPTP